MTCGYLLESNHFLRSLNLEDLKLSDCLPEILNLLRDCKLEGKKRRMTHDAINLLLIFSKM